jgi:ABC-type multidrug transport system fused ATPase/permease subunit
MSNWFQELVQLLRNLNRLRPHIRPNRWLVLAAVLTATASAFFEIAGIGLLIPLIALMGDNANAVLNGRFLRFLPELWPNRPATFYVWIFCGLVIGAILIKNLFFIGYQRLMAHFSRRVSCNLRESLFDRLQGASLHVFEERQSGQLLNAYSAETIRAQGAVEFLLLFVQRCFLTICYLVGIILLSWEFMVGLLGLVLIVGAMSALFYKRLGRRGDQRSEAQRDLFGFIGGIFAGVRIVRATRAEAHARDRFAALSNRLGNIEVQGSFLSSLMSPATETLAVSGAIVLLALANLWLIQTGKLDRDSLMIIGLGLIRLLPLINQLYGILGQLVYFGGGVRETLRWLEVPQFPQRPFGQAQFERVATGIRLEQVSFTFPNGKVALDNINLTIPSGQTVALVGASGSGKTTLASLLLRLREPTSGHIWVDGTDYWNFSSDSWHRRLGMVEQEAYLFNDSIRNNITVGCPEATPAQLQAAVQMAHLGDVIEQLPAGLESVVGERGTMLSGGQKQRLAIARAMVRDPQLLILDEATSALDNVSERQVQAALDAARHGRTSVVIAHRLSTIRNADLIVVLEGGRIVEQGTWAELEIKSGRFSRLLAAAQKSPDSEASLPLTGN